MEEPWNSVPDSASRWRYVNCEPGRVPLDWTAIFELLIEAARGLVWMHQEYWVSGTPHGNIKFFNILIRLNHDAWIADFGFSLLLSPTHVVARLVNNAWIREFGFTKAIDEKSLILSRLGVSFLSVNRILAVSLYFEFIKIGSFIDV
ncbi:Leucine-rich repeat receptor-like protein kinase PXC1 [Carex littledalei]|uniref:Leucine-rich repeat receptor-like protein kinase PXC1 n=1 Tax=Carex littledalei TaxID=544730 RepID=A0A833RG91_9POAL|nr:Leucine-rich repeat receptor-like protein kinase PXC1 [Carex littledalei]